jgi:hypothetical protein
VKIRVNSWQKKLAVFSWQFAVTMPQEHQIRENSSEFAAKVLRNVCFDIFETTQCSTPLMLLSFRLRSTTVIQAENNVPLFIFTHSQLIPVDVSSPLNVFTDLTCGISSFIERSRNEQGKIINSA